MQCTKRPGICFLHSASWMGLHFCHLPISFLKLFSFLLFMLGCVKKAERKCANSTEIEPKAIGFTLRHTSIWRHCAKRARAIAGHGNAALKQRKTISFLFSLQHTAPRNERLWQKRPQPTKYVLVRLCSQRPPWWQQQQGHYNWPLRQTKSFLN